MTVLSLVINRTIYGGPSQMHYITKHVLASFLGIYSCDSPIYRTHGDTSETEKVKFIENISNKEVNFKSMCIAVSVSAKVPTVQALESKNLCFMFQ